MQLPFRLAQRKASRRASRPVPRRRVSGNRVAGLTFGDGDRGGPSARQRRAASKIASLEQFNRAPRQHISHAYPFLGHLLHRDRQLRRHRRLLAAGAPAGAGARTRGAAVGR
ncbi:conserved hypothetical protein [Cupriavidus taiwanensis]|nr:conserved hypothetical protein [Cupriavidus taiwanensis]